MRPEKKNQEPENNVLGGTLATKTATRAGDTLPHLRYRAIRSIEQNVQPNAHLPVMEDLRILWVLDRHIHCYFGVERFVVKDGAFLWRTSRPSASGGGFLVVKWPMSEDGILFGGEVEWGTAPPESVPMRRPLPIGSALLPSPHGIDQAMKRSNGHLPRDVVFINIQNHVKLLQSRGALVQQSLYYDQTNRKVRLQFLVPDAQGGVCALRLLECGDLLHATTLEQQMASRQISLTHPRIPSTRHWDNDGSGAPGVCA